MKIKSLKHNFLMYSLRLVSGILFTLLIFPLVAKILGPTNIGKIQYVESIVMYFLLFINLGIPTYGRREIAFLREDKYKMSKFILEVLLILIIMSIFIILVYLYLILNLKNLIPYKSYFLLYLISLIFNLFSFEWFFMGIEDQEYITKRSVIFKVISAIAIFMFIKKENDASLYILVTIFALNSSNLLNFKRMFKFIKFEKKMIKDLIIIKHLKPIIFLFATSLATTVFSTLDSIMIRNLISEKALGYYALASKVGRMPRVLVTSIYTVFYPRLCNLVSNQKNKEYIILGNKGLDFSLLLAFPLTIGMFVLAPEIINLFGGKEYNQSIIIFRGFSFLMIAMAYAMFTGQNLIINSKEKIYMKGQVIASTSNVIFNFIMIPILGSVGAAIGTVLAEIIAIIYRIKKGKDIFKKFEIFDLNKFKIIISSLLMGIIIFFMKNTLEVKNIVSISINLVLGILSYSVFLLIFKEKNTLNIFGKALLKYKKKEK